LAIGFASRKLRAHRARDGGILIPAERTLLSCSLAGHCEVMGDKEINDERSSCYADTRSAGDLHGNDAEAI
jgi:hypothetical protein